MHEGSLMRGLLRAIEAAAKAQGGGRVRAVGLRVGALAAISPGHLREHWAEARRGSIAEGARLTIEGSDDVTAPYAGDVVVEWVELDVGR